MAKSGTDAEYPIAAVSKLTGVSCHALRVWERRYGFPVPLRSPSGHRRYGHDEVMLLRRVCELARAGGSIGELIANARAGRLDVQEPSGARAEPEADPETGWDAGCESLVEALMNGDFEAGGVCFDRLQAGLS